MTSKRLCAFTARLAGFFFCKYCGLFNLPNEATQKEIRKGCAWFRDE